MIPEIVLKTNTKYPSAAQGQRLDDIILAMQNFDVVCLQEVFGGIYSETRSKLIPLAIKAGFLYHVEDDDPHFASTYISDGGLMILSRFPIVGRACQPFSYSQEQDGLVRRSCLYAKIKLAHRKHLHIFTTHMCSSHWLPAERAPKMLRLGLEARKIQIREACEFVKECLDEEFEDSTDCALLTGDFNVDRNQASSVMRGKLEKSNSDFKPLLD